MMLWSVWLEPAVKKHANVRPLQALRFTEKAKATLTLCVEEVTWHGIELAVLRTQHGQGDCDQGMKHMPTTFCTIAMQLA